MAQRQRLNKEIQQIDDKTENVYAQEAQLNAKGSLKLTTQVGPNGKAAVSDADITTYGQVLQTLRKKLEEAYRKLPATNMPDRSPEHI